MRLLSLTLENFRQHRHTELTFTEGITGILGANGAGKSTILEAIAWALYGNQSGVTRGNAESLIWRRAPGQSSAIATLCFAFDRHTYTIRRSQAASKGTVELQQDGRAIANSTRAVAEKIAELLGMTHQEFFTSYFTGQKDLQFLGSVKGGGADRERFIAKMLGYDRLIAVQGEAGKPGTIRHDKRNAERQVAFLEGARGNLAEIEREIGSATTQQQEAHAALAAATATLAAASTQRLDLEPQRERLEQLREAFQQRDRARQVKAASQAQLDRAIAQLDRDLPALERDASAHAQLAAEVADYETLTAAWEAMDAQRQQAVRHAELVERQQQMAQTLAELDRELDTLTTAEADLDRLRAGIARDRAQRDEAEAALRAETLTWQQQQADLKGNLTAERQALKKLQAQQATIAAAGTAGNCPTCTRPLEGEYETVMAHLEAHMAACRDRLHGWERDLHALQQPPPAIVAWQAECDRLTQHLREAQRQEADLIARSTRAELLQQQRAKLLADRDRLAADLDRTATDFDRAAYDRLSDQLQALKPKYKTYLQTATAPARLQEARDRRTQLEGERAALAAEIAALEREIADLDYSPDRDRACKEEIARATAAVEAARSAHAQTQQAAALATQALESARARLATYQQRDAEFKAAQQDLLLLEELDRSFTDLRQHLTEQIRPQLADAASEFLGQLTDGRYNALEIDEKYNVIVLDDGDRKPVISGGEEDIVNLSLRLALSQAIAQRSGRPFSLLILDEVFGSLDETRRDNVVKLLYNLERQFEQVLLITHIEALKESLNRTIQLEFDPQQQCTRLKAQS